MLCFIVVEIPITASDLDQEYLFPNFQSCPSLQELRKINKPYIMESDSYQYLAAYMSPYTGTQTDINA